MNQQRQGGIMSKRLETYKSSENEFKWDLSKCHLHICNYSGCENMQIDVNIIIPFKDKPELLESCINSIIKKTETKLKYQIYCINNQSTETATYQLIKKLKESIDNILFLDYNEPFNFSSINNYAFSNAVKSDYCVFMNNDIEIISSNWLDAMIESCKLKDTGAVGIELYYPDGTIQHSGIELNERFNPVHTYRGLHSNKLERKLRKRKTIAVTAALLMIRSELFDHIGGFDEELKVAYNDIDLCYRLKLLGFNIIIDEKIKAIHFESRTRGLDTKINSRNNKRLMQEEKILKIKHNYIIKLSKRKLKNQNYTIKEFEQIDILQNINTSIIRLSLKKRVLFISTTRQTNRPWLDPSTRYRCFDFAEIMTRNNMICDVIPYNEFIKDKIDLYDIFIFHRPPNNPTICDFLKLGYEKGKACWASYDDLIFGDYALESSIYKNKVCTKEEAINIFKGNTIIIKYFERFICSTKTLSDEIKKLKEDSYSLVIPNVLSYSTIARAKINKRNKIINNIHKRKHIISYLSGTKSHDKDFKLVENIIHELYFVSKLEFELWIVGPLEFNTKKLPFAKIINHVSYDQLSNLIAKTTINIAPLEKTIFNECKSGLKYFESGIYGVPTVATPIYDIAKYGKDKGILYATNELEWKTHIKDLITNKYFYQTQSNLAYENSIKLAHPKNNNLSIRRIAR